jgi:hypothetical protein
MKAPPMPTIWTDAEKWTESKPHLTRNNQPQEANQHPKERDKEEISKVRQVKAW